MATDPALQRLNFQFRDTLPSQPSYMPSKPNASSGGSMVFPTDLTHQDRKFYIDIQFVQYDGIAAAKGSLLGSKPIESISGGGIRLPLPRTINDRQTVIWEQNSFSGQVLDVGSNAMQGAVSAMKMGSGVVTGPLASALGNAAESIGQIIGSGAQALTGVSLNPFLYMLFKSPELKTFDFEWMLVPSTKKESDTVKDIIKEFKSKMLPTRYKVAGLGYPDVAKIKLTAGGTNDYLFKFKPCVLLNLSVNHTAAGNPSFFKSGAATVISISARFQEMEIWTREDLM